ncbi:hypothetical protein V6O07_18545, partial [Arthrospira platensis SPKY2]
MSLFVTHIGTEFIPETDESMINATIELQTGTRVDETLKTTAAITEMVQQNYPELKLIASSTGADDRGGFESMFSAGGTNIVSFTISLVQVGER